MSELYDTDFHSIASRFCLFFRVQRAHHAEFRGSGSIGGLLRRRVYVQDSGGDGLTIGPRVF
ncbi:unnamed protein product [Periconia digitata]|uniref:Uncharacterized protein n=1 Tax=Periconia digitata TaxID=1303443 RepID=A0A9W4XHB9_9PLEO|nr:unnamed protein product [Periconia digitata]